MESRTIEGTVEFMRGDVPGRCICCEDSKEKGHIYCKRVIVPTLKNECYLGYSDSYHDWMHDKIALLSKDGCRVRIRIEFPEQGELEDVTEFVTVIEELRKENELLKEYLKGLEEEHWFIDFDAWKELNNV